MSDKAGIYFIAVCCFLMFSLFYVVQINTPMQSDDYRYLSLGGNFSGLINHYFTWSGRLAADITSSSLLLFPKTIYSAFNSLALVSFAFLCVKLPSLLSKRRLNIYDGFNFIIITTLYWIANPNLGQTTFWIVGSANYLWTSLYMLMFLCFFVYVINAKKNNFIYSFLLFSLGILGGVTNENIGWITFVFVFFISLFFIKDKSHLDFRKVFLPSFMGGLLGWLLLVLAPGNSIRSQHPAFDYWYSKSIFERVYIHIYDRLPTYLSSYIFVFLVIVIVLSMLLLTAYQSRSHSEDNLLNKSFCFFIVCAILSSIMLVGSPSSVPRIGNTTLCVLLVAVSCLLSIYNPQKNTIGVKYNLFFYFVVLSCIFIYFTPSYYLFYKAIENTHYQEQVREGIIKDAINSQAEKINVPDFYFSNLMNKNDKFDLYHNGWEMAKYYGHGLKEIGKYEVGFNYGAIVNNDIELMVNKEVSAGLMLYRIIFYTEPDIPFYKKKNFALFEFNRSPYVYLGRTGKRIYFHLVHENESFTNSDIGTPNAKDIGGKFYYSHQIVFDKKITSIRVGVFDSDGPESKITLKY